MHKTFIGFMLFTLATVAAAQARVVTVGGTQLQLGTSQQEVLRILQPQYALDQSFSGDSYNVYQRGADGQAAGPSLGRVDFSDERLTRVTRSIGTLQGAEASVAMKNLIAALRSVPESTPVQVQTDVDETVTAVTSRVFFRLPDKIVQIAIYQPKTESAPVTVDITEQFDLLDPPG